MNRAQPEYEVMFQQSPLPMWIYDMRTLEFLDANRAMCEQFGYSREELLRMTLLDIRTPSEGDRLIRAIAELRGKPKGESFDEHGVWTYFTKEGRQIEMEARTVEITFGTREARLLVARDVTESRRAERALRASEERLRDLARRLQTVREQERAELSRTIHDELGQSLTALKIELAMISKRADPELTERIDGVAAAVDGLIQQVRNIATELRPGVLDHLGLVAASEWQAKEFARRCGIECKFEASSGELPLSKEESIALFRILQESLTNVARHAKAKSIAVSIRTEGDTLEMSVADDGVGMTEASRTATTSLGLVGMEERASAVGARLSFASSRGRGTRVVVTLPLLTGVLEERS